MAPVEMVRMRPATSGVNTAREQLGRDQSENGRSERDTRGELADDRRLSEAMRQAAGRPGDGDHGGDNQKCDG